MLTVPLVAIHFQNVSLISPLSNLLTLWAVSWLFSGGMMAGLLAIALPGPAAVLALPEKYSAVIHLHYYEGYTFQEIGEILHISPSAVSMRLHRGRKKLQAILKEDGYETAVSKNL